MTYPDYSLQGMIFDILKYLPTRVSKETEIKV